MPQFGDIETSVLIEMLSELTEKFTRLFRHYHGNNPSREFLNCKETLELIMVELDRRNELSKGDSKLKRHDEVRLNAYSQ